MIDTQYTTRHHELPLVQSRRRVAVVVGETSAWFRRSIQPHLAENVPVRIDAAEGYAYSLQARDIDRPPVLARSVVFRWRAGYLYLEAARGTDGQRVDLNALFAVPTVEEIAEEALRQTVEDPALSSSGLHPHVQSQLAETARQERALRRALLAQVLVGDTAAMCLCVKLLRTSFGGCDADGDLYQQASTKLATVPYAPHLRDLLATLITARRDAGAIRDAATDFCRHLAAAEIEAKWASELLGRA
jgi:hypothetical protein